MTHRERFNRTMHFQSADRIPNEEFGYWEDTLRRWRAEGMPAVEDEELYFGLDIRRERRLLPVDDGGPIPSLPFAINSLEDLERAKPYYDPRSPERYPADWEARKESYRNRDYPLGLNMSGFFGQPRGWLGLSRACTAYYDDPKLMHAIGEFWADFLIESSRKALEEVDLDFVQIWEDMAYNHGSLISPRTFKKFMTPHYRRVTDFIRSKGVDVILVDCDGDTNDLIPLFIEAGVTGIYPIEIVAGTDPIMIREKYPDFLMLGGIDKIAVAKGPEEIDREIDRAAKLMESGGYIPFIDHRAPPDITLGRYRYYMARKREIIGGDIAPDAEETARLRLAAEDPGIPWEYEVQPKGPSL